MHETIYQLPPGYRGGKASFVTYDTNLQIIGGGGGIAFPVPRRQQQISGELACKSAVSCFMPRME